MKKSSKFSSKKLVFLAYHVTYWDYLGWKDPHGVKAFGQKQSVYAKTKGHRSRWTPQFWIDGQVYRRQKKLTEMISDAAKVKPQVDLQVAVSPKEKGKLHLKIQVTSKAKDVKKCTVTTAIFQDGIKTSIPRGENAGVTLVEYAVVRRAINLGTVDLTTGKQTIEKTIEVPEKWRTKNTGLAVVARNSKTLAVYQAWARMWGRWGT